MSRLAARVPEPLRAAGLYAVGIAWVKAVGLLMVPLMTSALPPEEFGRLELLVSGAEIFGLLLGAGLLETLFRFGTAPGAEGRRTSGDVLALGMAISALGMAVLLPLSPWLATLVPLPTSGLEVGLLAVAVCMESLISVPLGRLRMEGRARAHVLVAVTRGTVQAGLVAALLLTGHGVLGVLAGGAFCAVAAAALLAAGQARSDGLRLAPRAWAPMLGYGLPLVGAGLASFALGSADRWILAPAVSAATLGAYAVACKFASLAAVLTQPFEMWWYPRRIRVLGEEGGLERTARTVDGLLAFAVLSAGATAVAAPPVIRLLTPEGYHAAAAMAPWVAVALCLQQASSLVNVGCYAGRTGAVPLAVNVAAATVAVLGYLLLIPEVGVAGAIAATILAQGTRLGLFWFLSRRRAPVPHRAGALLGTAALVGAAGWLPWGIPGPAGLAAGCAGLLAAAAAAVAVGLVPLPGRFSRAPKEAPAHG